MAIQPASASADNGNNNNNDGDTVTDMADGPDRSAAFITALDTAWADRDETTGTIPVAQLAAVGTTFRALRGNAAKSIPAEFQMARLGELTASTDDNYKASGMAALMAIGAAQVEAAQPATAEKVPVDAAIAIADALSALAHARQAIDGLADDDTMVRAEQMVIDGHRASDKRIQKVVGAAYVKTSRERSDVTLAELVEAGRVHDNDRLVWTIDDVTYVGFVNTGVDGDISGLADHAGVHSLSAACKLIRPTTSTGKPASYNGWACWTTVSGDTLETIRKAYETD